MKIEPSELKAIAKVLNPLLREAEAEEAEAERETETQYFVYHEGKKVSEISEAEAEEDCFGDTETGGIILEVSPCETEINAWNIEAGQFFGAEGVCRLTVNYFPLETALRIFGETIRAFEKANLAANKKAARE